VGTGLGIDDELNDMEVIDLSSSETVCQPLKNFLRAEWYAVGEIGIDGNPIICGGVPNDNSCYSYVNGDWITAPSLSTGRYGATIVRFNGSLIVSGGYNNDMSYLSSQELLTTSGWEYIISLPKPIHFHCMAQVNDSHIMSMGGYDGKEFLDDVNILDVQAEKWTSGPNLNNGRSEFSCAKIKVSQSVNTEAVIAVGGWNGDYMNTVEVLTLEDSNWKTGPALPIRIAGAQIVSDSNGGVILVGGATPYGPLNTLYKLPHLDGEWELLPQKLTTPRGQHIAFLMDDELTDCA